MPREPSLPQPPLPLLITGLTGVAGYNAFHYFHRRFPHQVVGLRQRSNWPLKGDGIVACDAEDHRGLTELFERYQFASVLNAAGNCALKSCELDPEMAYRVNLSGVRNLLSVMAGTTIRLVHLSIDLVFSGMADGDHVETDAADPVTVYGSSMAAAEHLIQLAFPDACMLRISLPMGVSYSGHAGAVDWIQSRFKQNKPATLYYDEVRTPTYTDCLNRVLQRVLANSLSGLYHAGGPRRLSLYQIAQIINRVGGYDPQYLQGCLRHEAGPIPPRAGNVTMDSSRLAKVLGVAPFDPWPWYDRHVPIDPEWHWRRDPGESSGPEYLTEVLCRNPRLSLPTDSLELGL